VPRKTFIIAEAGVNHNGSLEIAKRLVQSAVEAGADAIKFQTFCASSLVSRHAPKAEYQKAGSGADETQFEMLQRLELSEDAHHQLWAECSRLGIEFLSSPFDAGSLELLLTLGVTRIKLGSGELTNAPLLLAAARGGKPLVVSTGMSDANEVRAAMSIVAFGLLHPNGPPDIDLTGFLQLEESRTALRENVTLLHCTTEYPARFEDANLLAMETLRKEFGVPVGLSDHTPGVAVSVAAVALGAAVIEKHLTLDHNMRGPDHRASLQPTELKLLVNSIRQVELALGSGLKEATVLEARNRAVTRKSLVAARQIKKGERFTVENLAVKRPGSGVSPMSYWKYLGAIADRDYHADELIAPCAR
jgi:N-acetylneuraminate synthase